jgi:hypothetical protein
MIREDCRNLARFGDGALAAQQFGIDWRPGNDGFGK